MWIYRKLKEGFPQPIRFGGAKCVRRWRRADIEAWEAKWDMALKLKNKIEGDDLLPLKR